MNTMEDEDEIVTTTIKTRAKPWATAGGFVVVVVVEGQTAS